MDKILVAILGVAGAGLAAWLGALQIQVNGFSDQIANFNSDNMAKIEKIKVCERLTYKILDAEDASKLNTARAAKALFVDSGCKVP